MRKIIRILPVVIIVLLFGFHPSLYAQKKSLNQYDGTDWLGETPYASGFKIGLVTGLMWSAGVFSNVIKQEIEFLEVGLPDDYKGMTMFLETSISNLGLFSMTVGQVTDGIDVFYKDFQNRMIKIIDAVYVIMAQIEGKSPELIQAQIRYLRMQPISEEKVNWAKAKYVAVIKTNVEKNKYPSSITSEDISMGRISEEEVLASGRFIDKRNVVHLLFCYGNYY